jgi:hypothetical protein
MEEIVTELESQYSDNINNKSLRKIMKNSKVEIIMKSLRT